MVHSSAASTAAKADASKPGTPRVDVNVGGNNTPKPSVELSEQVKRGDSKSGGSFKAHGGGGGRTPNPSSSSSTAAALDGSSSPLPSSHLSIVVKRSDSQSGRLQPFPVTLPPPPGIVPSRGTSDPTATTVTVGSSTPGSPFLVPPVPAVPPAALPSQALTQAQAQAQAQAQTLKRGDSRSGGSSAASTGRALPISPLAVVGRAESAFTVDQADNDTVASPAPALSIAAGTPSDGSDAPSSSS